MGGAVRWVGHDTGEKMRATWVLDSPGTPLQNRDLGYGLFLQYL